MTAGSLQHYLDDLGTHWRIVDLTELQPEFPSKALTHVPKIYPDIGFADRLEIAVEPPFASDQVLRQVTANPHAALVCVQLLRLIEGMEPSAALVQESLAYGLLQGSAEHARWLATRAPSSPEPAGEIRLGREGASLSIFIDRPGSLNAIDCKLRDALHEAFTIAALDSEIERVELSSVGRAFSVGADLSEFGTTRDPATAHAIRMRTLPAHAILGCAERLHVHVQGGCVGSALEMSAFAHRVTASNDAWFQLPELGMGLIPGAGGCVSISRRIGRQRAALMILSGKRIRAETALEWGLIDAVVDA